MRRRREARDDGDVMALSAIATIFTFLISSARHGWAKEALRRVRSAQSTTVSGLRSIISEDDTPGSELVCVRGQLVCKILVHARSSNCCCCCRKKNDCFDPSTNYSTGNAIVMLAQLCLFGNLFRKEDDSPYSVELVPLALVEGDQYVRVVADKYRPLSAEKFRDHMHLVQSSSYPFLSVPEYPFVCNEGKIVQIDMEMTAIGIYRSRTGALEIQSSSSSPYFLSDKTKDFIEMDLTVRIENYLWASYVSGAISIGLICYAFFRKC